MTSASSIHEAGHSKLILRDNFEGGVGREVGEEFTTGVHMYTHG